LVGGSVQGNKFPYLWESETGCSTVTVHQQLGLFWYRTKNSITVLPQHPYSPDIALPVTTCS